MQLAYGNLLFPFAGAGVATAKATLFNAAGQPYEEQVQADVTGWWTGSTAQLIAAASIMEASLRVPGQNLVLFADDGSVALQMLNATSTSGVRCESVSFPDDGRGSAEFVTYRTFRARFTANYPLSPGAAVVLDWQETLQQSGGGPVTDFIQPANAPPIAVQLFQATPYRVTQAGAAVVRAESPVAYAAPQRPLWPGAVLRSPDVTRASKRTQARVWELTTRWSYDFGSVTPLLGLPNAWIG